MGNADAKGIVRRKAATESKTRAEGWSLILNFVCLCVCLM